jgi:2-(1,2-epoxy-1,2-dihydrophenyl)acetyl-CoA isomerase
MPFDTVEYEVEDKLAWITLNRPDQLNAFAGDMREELLQCLLQAQDDEKVKVVVITGKGRAFSAGGDVKHMVAMKEEKAGFDRLRPLLDQGRRVVTVVHQMPKPVIAMVNGAAAGAGCSLALACDLRIASDSAYFSVSHIQIGLHPDWGGTFFLPRLIGVGRALEMMWTGRRIEAEEAEEIGLVHHVVPQAHLVEQTTRYARRLAKAPTNAVRLIKLAVYNSAHYDLDGMLDYECEAQEQCWESPDSREGIRAFAERRRPSFDRR